MKDFKRVLLSHLGGIRALSEYGLSPPSLQPNGEVVVRVTRGKTQILSVAYERINLSDQKLWIPTVKYEPGDSYELVLARLATLVHFPLRIDQVAYGANAMVSLDINDVEQKGVIPQTFSGSEKTLLLKARENSYFFEGQLVLHLHESRSFLTRPN